MIQIETENILAIINSTEQALKLNELSKLLKIRSATEEYESLKEVLETLVLQSKIKKISRRRYIRLEENAIVSTSYRITGIYKIFNGKGSIIDKTTGLKYQIKRKYSFTALDNDLVEINPLAERKGKKLFAEIIKIIERADRLIPGTIEYDGFFYFLQPDDIKYDLAFLIPETKLKQSLPSDKVVARFLKWDDPHKNPEVEIIRKLGDSGDYRAEFETVIHDFNLPIEFNDDVINEAKKINFKINDELLKRRLDLRKEDIITIDPFDAKDFDDALSLKILENGNYYLGVHIADVSHFVIQGSQIDSEALSRGNSTYLVDRVIPMLPENLSNEICSLKPLRNRLTFSVFMEFSKSGILKDYKITESIIKSKCRFSYDEVFDILKKGTGKFSDLLIQLDTLATILRNKRFKSGGVNFETTEIKFVLNSDNIPEKAILKSTTRATSLVEECMLAANKTVSEHILKLSKINNLQYKLPFLYRVHDEPNPEKLNNVLDFILKLGHIKQQRSNKASYINKVIEEFENKPEKPIVHQLLVRSMPRAEYQPENIGHWGLGFTYYSHFTSPIRRYPDLIVHRLLKEYAEKLPDINRMKSLTEYLKNTGQYCSATERNSMEAERASNKLAQTILSKKYIGKSFSGTISGVTSFGLFVILDDLYSEGMVHIKDIVDDYYIFDEKMYRLIGRQTKKIYQFGDKINVKIIKVNIEKRKIELAVSRKHRNG